MIRRFVSYALCLLERHNIVITFIDVDSRNGILELGDVAQFV